MPDPIYGPFYSPEKVKSYGRNYMFCIASRSTGKTTGWGIDTLLDFLKNGRQWIYTRRTKDELDVTKRSYFTNAAALIQEEKNLECEVKFDKGVYKVNGKTAGYAVPLNLQHKFKSTPYDGVGRIIYDEFMVSPGSSRYMKQEATVYSYLYQTVARGQHKSYREDVLAIFLGNAGTYYNPFFIEYQVDRYLRPETKYLAPKGVDWVVEQLDGVEATKDFENSVVYRMSPEASKKYAFNNKYADMLGSSAFIEKTPSGDRTPLVTLQYDGESYAVYAFMKKGYLWITHGTCEGRPVIALNAEDHRPNYLLITQWHGHYITKMIKDMYEKSFIRFRDRKCKMALDFYLKYDII